MPCRIIGLPELTNISLNSISDFLACIHSVLNSDIFLFLAISWEIEGVNTTGLEISESSIRTESGVSSIVNISATHFRGSESSLGRRVTCSAANTHGVAKKEFVVSVRKGE